MKILWFLCLILLSACLQVKHQAATNSHLTLSHEGVIEAHENPFILPAVVATLASLAFGLKNTFVVNCDATGYLRNTYIQVENNLPNAILWDTTYLDSGKIYQNGKPTIAPNTQAQKWIFTKKSGSATGANGVISFKYGNHKIALFFENPWSGMAGAGLAFKPIGSSVGEGTYDQMYDDWCDYKKTVTDTSKANSGWFKNAFYIETKKADRYNIGATAQLTAPDNSFSILLAFYYQAAQGTKGSRYTCYNNKLSLKFVPYK